jgi:outer membrane protein TolC
MSRPHRTAVAFLLIALTISGGCHPVQPFFFHEDGDLSHYLDKATQMETPDVDTVTLADAKESKEPLTVSNPEFEKIWDLTLEECISITLHNSKTIRNLGGVTPFGFADALVERTGNQSIYDAAIQESGDGNSGIINGPQSASDVGRATRERLQTVGPEAALSDFDALFRVTAVNGPTAPFWSRTNRPTNRVGTGGVFATIDDETNSGLRSEVIKKSMTGTRFTVTNNTNYDRWEGALERQTDGTMGPPAFWGKNQSYWTTDFEVRVDQPLLRGRGTQINRIPLILARINTDITLASFEGAVRNLVMDVENTYWDLHLAFRNLETAKIGRDSAQVTWKIAYEKWNQGVEPVQAEAQAREQYFNFRAQVENSLRDLYNRENQLRFLMGLAATDGRLIRPIDEPTMAKVSFDWRTISAEALVRSPELRQQKWSLKQRELELTSAKNQLLPKLDVGAIYKWVGRGNDLIQANRNGARFPADPGSSAFEELTGGDYQEFALFFDFAVPVGYRRELAGVRHAQLQLARDKARLEDMELNTAHLLTTAIRNVDSSYVLAQTHFNRWSAAEKEVESVLALYKGGKTTLDLVLDAQKRRAQAQSDFYRAVCEHSKAIAEVHFRKGSLLEYNNVELAEGPWPQKAYWDAVERARERDASYYLNYGWTRPAVVSQGPVPQGVDPMTISDMLPGEPTPAETPMAPSPEPAEDGAAGAGQGGSILNKPAPKELGPMTGDPSGPLLNAPVLRTADGGVTTRPPQGSRFDWDSLGLGGAAPPAVVPSAVVPTGFSAEVTDR